MQSSNSIGSFQNYSRQTHFCRTRHSQSGAEFSSDSSYTWIVHCSPQLHVHLCFTSCSACDSIPQYPQPHSSVSRACSPAPGWKLRRKSAPYFRCGSTVLPEIPKSEGLFLAFVHCSSEPQYIRTSRTHSCRFPY